MSTARTARISDSQWDEVKPRIEQLFYEGIPLKCKDNSRETIPDILQRDFSLCVTVSQLEAKLKAWGFGKNLKLQEWATILPCLDGLETNGRRYQLFLAEKKLKRTP